jgi:hypothetical protein
MSFRRHVQIALATYAPHITLGVALSLIIMSVAFGWLQAVPVLRQRTGESEQVSGTVVSSGVYEHGGTRLSGRTQAIMVVKLTDGELVQVGTPNSIPFQVGAAVTLKKYEMSFGQPGYVLDSTTRK